MLSKRFCFRKAQSMTSGILYPYRVVLQPRRPIGSGRRCATWITNTMNRAQYHRVLEELPLQGCILDTGFRNGDMLKRVLKRGCCSVYGTGISESCMIAVEQKLLPSPQRGYLKLAMDSAESLPFADTYMDMVYSISMIYFWESLDKGLCEVTHILRPQGMLLLAFYGKRFMSRLLLCEYGFQLYDSKDVRVTLKHNGYMSIEVHEVEREKSHCIRAKCGDVQERRI